MNTAGAMNDAMPAVEAWLRQRGVGWICAVSPHLDDVAFSIATFLAHPTLPPREVWTVFSATTADGNADYAKATGFADPLAEFEARRDEDSEAMRILGVSYRHVGVVASAFDAGAATAVADAIRTSAQQQQGASLVLLPAGAGVEPSAWQRLWARVMRRPVGCRAHDEHERVRDALAGALDGTCLVGYYAEVPYLWSEGPQRLHARLDAMTRRRWQPFAVASKVDLKLRVANAYRSQVVLILGDQPSFQRRSLGAPEWLFLPT